MAGIYLHIPYCKQACYYCDFHFSTNQETRGRLIEAMNAELELRRDYLEDTIETIYFGGGTPSLLELEEIQKLLTKINSCFNVSPDAEITLEANPDDLTEIKLNDLKKAGVNRLSIGIQSFSDEILRFLNRAHDRETAKEAFERARRAGFSNISLDLIYGIPNQSLSTLQSDLDLLLSMSPEHVSCYGLTIEEQTVFGKWSRSGKFKGVDDETGAAHFNLVIENLTRAGYDHYEISNFSKPGYYSKHNSSYWLRKKYLGVGPSAHSYDGNTRQYNVSNNHVYLRSIQNGDVFFEKEILTRIDKINEYLLTSLRTSWGCDLDFLIGEFDYRLLEEQSIYLNQKIRDGLIIIEGNLMKLTHEGKFVADEILAELVLVNPTVNDY